MNNYLKPNLSIINQMDNTKQLTRSLRLQKYKKVYEECLKKTNKDQKDPKDSKTKNVEFKK
jgi:hypothetical protein